MSHYKVDFNLLGTNEQKKVRKEIDSLERRDIAVLGLYRIALTYSESYVLSCNSKRLPTYVIVYLCDDKVRLNMYTSESDKLNLMMILGIPNDNCFRVFEDDEKFDDKYLIEPDISTNLEELISIQLECIKEKQMYL